MNLYVFNLQNTTFVKLIVCIIRNSCIGISIKLNILTYYDEFRARSSAIDFTQLGHQKCFGTE